MSFVPSDTDRGDPFSTPQSSSQPAPSVPDHELIRRIGRGAYGEVWLAQGVTGAYRAVKIVHRDSFDHDRPFEREFEGILQFEPLSRRHESQLDILHVGRNGASFYYVMELADDQATGGQIPDPKLYLPRTLKSDLLFRGRLPFEECVQFGIALATALEHLHVNGLVHRDVKPSNIIFVNGVPKLADIGLVTGVDTTRSYVGTEGFAAPEGPGSPQGDVYSLGKVLYEAATGKDRQEFPELPTQLRELPDRDGLMELNAVIARACRHDPKDRYVSAAAMRADLELLQSGKSLARLHRTEARLRRVHRVGKVFAAIALVIAAGWLWQARQTHVVRELVTEKSRLAEEKSLLAEENRERLVRLSIANGVRLMDQDDYSGALLWFAEALPLVTNRPAEESIHRIRIQQMLNQNPALVQIFTNESSILCGAFSPDGGRIATGDYESVRVWDAESGRLLLGPVKFPRPIAHLRYSADGRRLLVSSSSDEVGKRVMSPGGFVAVIDSSTGREVWPLVTNVTIAAFSPDAQRIAILRTNVLIQVLDSITGTVIANLAGNTNGRAMCTFSHDGGLLASASLDKLVRLWRIPSGEPVGKPIRHERPVWRVVFSPDGKRISTVDSEIENEKQILVHSWDTLTGTEIGAPIPIIQEVWGLTYDTQRGQRLLFADQERGVHVVDAETHLPMYPLLTFENSSARCLAFSPDGVRFAAGSDDGTVRVWNLETGKPLTPRLRHVGWVESVHFSPDGSKLLTTSDDGTAKLWNLATEVEAKREVQMDSAILNVEARLFNTALNREGNRLLLGMEDLTVRLLNLDTLTQEGAPMARTEEDIPGTVEMDRSGRQWAIANGFLLGNGRSRGVDLWREDGGERRHLVLNHPQVVRFVHFSPDGERLWTFGEDFHFRTWQTVDGKLLDERAISESICWISAMSSEGDRIVVSNPARVSELHFLGNSGTNGIRLEGYPLIGSAAFSPDGERLAGVAFQHGYIWDAATGRTLTRPFKHGGALSWTEWSPDGRRVLTAGLSGEVKVREAGTGELACAPFALGFYPVRVAHFSPDGRCVVARGDEDNRVRVWEGETAEAITPIFHHAGEVRAAFITKNQLLVSVSVPNRVQTWALKETHLPASVIADYARLAAGRTLNRAGVMLPSPLAEISRLSLSLHSNQPSLFANNQDQLRDFHRRQVLKPSNLELARIGGFHLDCLAQLSPSDPWVTQQQTLFRSLDIPPRDPATPANLIDLSHSYTHSLDMPPYQELTDFPRGIQELAGSRFDLRGMVVLEATNQVWWGPLMASRGISVDRRCRQLQFLQGVAGGGPPEGEELAVWVVHYADGSRREWPVRYGEQVRDWWWYKTSPKDAGQALIAWEGRPSIPATKGAENVRLFKATWTNPQPDLEVTQLDFILGKTEMHPFVVAITAE